MNYNKIQKAIRELNIFLEPKDVKGILEKTTQDFKSGYCCGFSDAIKQTQEKIYNLNKVKK